MEQLQGSRKLTIRMPCGRDVVSRAAISGSGDSHNVRDSVSSDLGSWTPHGAVSEDERSEALDSVDIHILWSSV